MSYIKNVSIVLDKYIVMLLLIFFIFIYVYSFLLDQKYMWSLMVKGVLITRQYEPLFLVIYKVIKHNLLNYSVDLVYKVAYSNLKFN